MVKTSFKTTALLLFLAVAAYLVSAEIYRQPFHAHGHKISSHEMNIQSDLEKIVNSELNRLLGKTSNFLDAKVDAEFKDPEKPADYKISKVVAKFSIPISPGEWAIARKHIKQTIERIGQSTEKVRFIKEIRKSPSSSSQSAAKAAFFVILFGFVVTLILLMSHHHLIKYLLRKKIQNERADLQLDCRAVPYQHAAIIELPKQQSLSVAWRDVMKQLRKLECEFAGQNDISVLEAKI